MRESFSSYRQEPDLVKISRFKGLKTPTATATDDHRWKESAELHFRSFLVNKGIAAVRMNHE